MHHVQSTYDEAARFFSSGDYHSALKLILSATESQPDEGPLWQLQGLIFFAIKDYENAVSSLETATLLSVLSIAAQAALAESYLRLGKDDLAKTVFATWRN